MELEYFTTKDAARKYILSEDFRGYVAVSLYYDNDLEVWKLVYKEEKK